MKMMAACRIENESILVLYKMDTESSPNGLLGIRLLKGEPLLPDLIRKRKVWYLKALVNVNDKEIMGTIKMRQVSAPPLTNRTGAS